MVGVRALAAHCGGMPETRVAGERMDNRNSLLENMRTVSKGQKICNGFSCKEKHESRNCLKTKPHATGKGSSDMDTELKIHRLSLHICVITWKSCDPGHSEG